MKNKISFSEAVKIVERVGIDEWKIFTPTSGSSVTVSDEYRAESGNFQISLYRFGDRYPPNEFYGLRIARNDEDSFDPHITDTWDMLIDYKTEPVSVRYDRKRKLKIGDLPQDYRTLRDLFIMISTQTNHRT